MNFVNASSPPLHSPSRACQNSSIVAGRRIYLYDDGAGWHTGDPVDALLADLRHFDLDYLPACHPELNPMDRLWKVLRYEATTNRHFPLLDDLWQGIRAQQRRWSPQKIRSVCSMTYCR